MGRGRRVQPKKLKLKLKAIRNRMGFTQQDMVEMLQTHAPGEFVDPSYISQYESGKREPSLFILLAYSKITGISINILVDDKMDLPEQLPAKARELRKRN